jgi:hypothetical protein
METPGSGDDHEDSYLGAGFPSRIIREASERWSPPPVTACSARRSRGLTHAKRKPRMRFGIDEHRPHAGKKSVNSSTPPRIRQIGAAQVASPELFSPTAGLQPRSRINY